MMDRESKLVTAAMAIITLAVIIGLGWVGAHRTQTHRDNRCRHGIATACALDGRN